MFGIIEGPFGPLINKKISSFVRSRFVLLETSRKVGRVPVVIDHLGDLKN